MVCLPLRINDDYDDDDDDDDHDDDNSNNNDKVTYTMYKSNNSDTHKDTGLVNRKIDTQYTSC